MTISQSLITIFDLDKSRPVYISSKMSGLSDLGKSILDDMKSSLESRGFINIMNPYDMVDQTQDMVWGDCLKIDIRNILNADVQAVFPHQNWVDSKGAYLEVMLSLILGIPLFDYNSGRNITMELYDSITVDRLWMYSMFRQMVLTHDNEG